MLRGFSHLCNDTVQKESFVMIFGQYKRTDCWITMGENYGDALQPFYITFITYINGKEAISPIKENKAAHECQDCVGGLGFRAGS